MSKSTITAIEFGTSKIVTIVGRSTGAPNKMKYLGSGTVPYDGYMNGMWNTEGQMLKRVSDSIAAAELESNTHITELYVGIPGDYILVREGEAEIETADGRIVEEDADAVNDAVAEKLQIMNYDNMVLHRSVAWYCADDGAKQFNLPRNGSSIRGKISFIMADKQFIADIREIMGRLGITILGFVSSTLGEARHIVPTDNRDYYTSVVIDCGYLETEVSAIRGDALVYHAMLPMGGGHITAELASRFSIPMRSAERLKRKFSFNADEFTPEEANEAYNSNGEKVSFPADEIAECVEGVAGKIIEMIDLTLTNEVDDMLTADSKIYLTGGGLMIPGVRQYIADRIRRPIDDKAEVSGKLRSDIYDAARGVLDMILESVDDMGDKKNGSFAGVFTGFRKKK